MTIKEIEMLSGMDRANVRFYERKGFITPERLDNGYRDYSDDDLQILLRIKLLRSLHIPLDEILALKDGSENLADTLTKQITRLEQEQQGALYAQNVCRAIQKDRATFADLDAQKYLDGIDRSMTETGNPYFTVRGDELPYVFHPWRRYLARMLDISLYNALWSVFLAVVFHVNLEAGSNIRNIIGSFMAIAIMLVLEPLLLHLFGTTPGKAIMGLRIENYDGRCLSYGEGFERTWGVLSSGLGYNIPIYNVVRLWKSYMLCAEKGIQPWDESISYTIKDTKWYRGLFYAGAWAAIIALLVTMASAQRLPPNRGDLSVAEFVENHNYYAKFFGIDFGRDYLNENGKWAEKDNDGTVYIDIGDAKRPEYHFTTENGYVTGISFVIEQKNNTKWISPYDTQMILTSLAFAGAQDEAVLFSKIPNRIIEQITNNTFEDFSFTEAGITFTCDIEYSGYVNIHADFLLPEEDAAESYFSLNFSMNKLK